MNRPSFLQGVGVALAASVVGAGAHVLLRPVLGAHLALEAVIALLGLGYVVYLLAQGRSRLGRPLVLALWAVTTATAAFVAAPLTAHVLAQLAVIWITRVMRLHRGVLAALADLGLLFAGLAAAAWAVAQSAGFGLAIWCFFLVQAGVVAIPAWGDARVGLTKRGATDDDPFERAHRAAEAAVRRLSQAH